MATTDVRQRNVLERSARYRSPVRFQLLGPLVVSNGDGPLPIGGPKPRLVLAHLLLRVNKTVPADTLIEAVWGEEPPETARGTLQTYVSRLRGQIGAERLEGEAPGYRFHADPLELDSIRFEALLKEATEDGLSPAETLRALDQALELWRGPALADLADEASLLGEISRLEELRLIAVEERIAARLDLGQHAEVATELERLTAAHPMRERLWGQLILALYRSGRQADALAAFGRMRELLADQLGIDPSRELQDLHERVLRQDDSLRLSGEPLRGYRLLERIGEGAFGEVYRAIQPHVEREVAIKSIHAELANQPDFVRRFEREAQLVARLEHPHIVPLYDYWREPDAAHLVMRFLRGGSLEDLLDDGPLDLERASRILDQTGAALAAAHQQGVVHRDVKPGNILLDEEGNAYLSDFGIALETGAPEQTAGTMIRGTPAYLSPEQIKLEQTTPRSDVYALGVVLYEMLTGEHPFPGTSLNVLLDQHLHQPIPSVRAKRPEIAPAVDAAIAGATAKDPAARFADVLDLCAAFRDSVGGGHVAVAREARNPYKGLRAFLEADSADFFGREVLTRRLLERVAEPGAPRFLCVVGPSGSGKSSVVRAGLVPAIRRGAIPGSDRWFVVDLVPGAHPLRELESALLGVGVNPPPSLLDELERDERGLIRAVDRILPEPDAELLIVLDQLEELFTLVDSDAERAHLLESIQAATSDPGSRIRVVATLRADFFDQPLSVRGFGELLAARTEAITPMSPDELERAIVGPAERVSLDVEPGLVAAMVADVIDRPGALPLLQYALTELADRDDVASLTLAAYRRIGGVSGALARRAEHLYEGLDDPGRAACRQLFLRLVTLGEGSDDTRRRVRRSELPSTEATATDAAIEAFGRHRLLSFDRDPETREPTVEIAHEALLRAWARLRGWIDEGRDDLRTRAALEGMAAAWTGSGREDSFLLRGARLEQLSAWADDTTIELSAEEGTFLEASRSRRAAEQQADEQRRQREIALERRSTRRARSLVAVFAFAALVAGSLTVVARRENARADREARTAQARELAAESVASLEEDPERAILLALEAVRRARPEGGAVLRDAEEALHRAVTTSRVVLTVRGLGGSVDWSSKGVFVTEGPEDEGIVDVRDAATGARVLEWVGHDIDVNDVGFSPDGEVLLTSGDDEPLPGDEGSISGTVRAWEAGSGDQLWEVRGTGPAWSPSFSADGSLVVASWPEENAVRVIDPTDGRVVRTFGEVELPFGPGLSPDGSRVAVPSGFGPDIRIYDVATGEQVEDLIGHPNGSNGVAWSPDGRWIASAANDARPWIWDSATGRLRYELVGHTAPTRTVDWSEDSTRLLTGSVDGTARVWEIGDAGAHEVLRLTAQESRAGVLAVFSPGADQVMTSDFQLDGREDVVKIYDVGLSGTAEIANVRTADYGMVDVAFLPDGRLAAADGRGSIALWNASGQRTRVIGPGPDGAIVWQVDVSDDGSRIATARAFAQAAAVWDPADGEAIFEAQASGEVSTIDLSSDGEFLAVGSWSGQTAIFDANGSRVATLVEEPNFEVWAVRFNADGSLAYTTSFFNNAARARLTIWDWREERAIERVDLRVPALGLAVDPQGHELAVARDDGRVQIRDAATGRKIREFAAVQGGSWDVAYSPDGTLLAVAGFDGTARLFDPSSGTELLVLRAHDRLTSAIAFSADGRWLATGSPDGIARVWTLDLDELIRIAHREVTRELTDDECRQYLHLETCPV